MAEITHLAESECELLLRSGHVGRVALTTPHGPEIVPVNYAVRSGAVVIRTEPAGFLARHGEGRRVAFEMDVVDEEYGTAWSVVAHGVGMVDLDPPARGSVPLGTVPTPYADGARSCEFRLTWTSLTGRRVGRGAVA